MAADLIGGLPIIIGRLIDAVIDRLIGRLIGIGRTLFSFLIKYTENHALWRRIRAFFEHFDLIVIK